MATYVLNDSKMFSDIADGIAIIINSETGIYYGMNGFATVVFAGLMSGASTEALLEELRGLPGVPDDMEKRLEDMVSTLKKYEIIVEGEVYAPDAIDLDSATALADDFILTVQEYSDAQELLLADPIHEVKDESGWQPDKSALETDETVVQQKEAKMKKQG